MGGVSSRPDPSKIDYETAIYYVHCTAGIFVFIYRICEGRELKKYPSNNC